MSDVTKDSGTSTTAQIDSSGRSVIYDPTKLHVFSSNRATPSACSYYRIMTPTKALVKQKFAQCYVDRARHEDQKVVEMMLTSDIILFYAAAGDWVERTIRSIKDMRVGWNDTRTEKVYPPSLVFDVDDNLDWVHPFNETYVRFGTRAYDGTLLKPGDGLSTTLGDGSEIMVWQDRETEVANQIFDIARNHKTIHQIHDIARACDGVTCPSPYLARYYAEVHKCRETYVFPNSIVPEDYPAPHLVPHDGVRILWQGGGSHMVDWFPLRDAVRTISLKYPQVTWVIWGSSFKWVHDNIPDAQLEIHDWIEYDGYKPMRTIMDCDINLCPLQSNEFNNSKSAIKWYESVMPYEPEATLAGNAGPYAEEMKEGETGLLYRDADEFVEKLSVLIENAELRRNLAYASRKWVLDNRHVEKTVPGLFEFYNHLRDKKKAAMDA